MRTVWPIALLVGGCWTSTQVPPPSAPSAPVVTRAPPMKVAAAPTDRFDQSTPRSALYSFVLAIEQDRFDVILRFVPDAYRAKLTEQEVRAQFALAGTQQVIEELKKHLDNPLQESGDEARMLYGTHFEVKLVREAGGWKIKDLD